MAERSVITSDVKCLLIGVMDRNVSFQFFDKFNLIPKRENFTWSIGFAFIYMEDERDAEAAIRALDRVEFGRKGRRLRVEWTKVTHN